MSGGISTSPPIPSPSVYSRTPSNTQITSRCCSSITPWKSSVAIVPRASRDNSLCSSSVLKLKPMSSRKSVRFFPKDGLRCNCSSSPGGTGESDSKRVLDAFFLGKALAEALNERIESTVGEFLSTVGRLQAEQQKQVQEFQEEVHERAKKAKQKAAREATEAQGIIPKPSAAKDSTIAYTISKPAPSASDASAVVPSSISSSSEDQNPTSTDPSSGISIDD